MTDNPLDVPPTWRRAADEILERGWRRSLVIGQTDVGKSACCRYLARRLLDAGTRVGVVDADVGQKDIGPPATVTLGYPEVSQSFPDTAPAAFQFIGSTDPIRQMSPLVAGIRRLVLAADAPVILINTPGAVHGPGRRLLVRQIDAVEPDVILAIEKRQELAAFLATRGHDRILRLTRSPQARSKSKAARAAARRRAFAQYFVVAETRNVDMAQLIVQPMRGNDEDDGELQPDQLCGVANHKGDGMGLAILQAIDPARERLALLTPVSGGQIAILQPSRLRIDRDGRELGDKKTDQSPLRPER